MSIEEVLNTGYITGAAVVAVMGAAYRWLFIIFKRQAKSEERLSVHDEKFQTVIEDWRRTNNKVENIALDLAEFRSYLKEDNAIIKGLSKDLDRVERGIETLASEVRAELRSKRDGNN